LREPSRTTWSTWRAGGPRDDGHGPIAVAATLACLLEASAEKVGNVTPSRSFADARYEDFVVSGLAFGPAIEAAGRIGVGRAVFEAVRATRREVATNTNLGIALLFAPIAAAWSSPGRGSLRQRLARVLGRLTTEDAIFAYRAIALAQPGGLGRVAEADVRRRPSLTLREAMALAARRDAIAAEYAGDFHLTFDVALPALGKALHRGLGLLVAIVHAHLDVLARVPDTLIARKAGVEEATSVSRRARDAMRKGGMLTRAGRAAAGRLDSVLRRDENRLNPGTSADLVAAALFVWLLPPGRRA